MAFFHARRTYSTQQQTDIGPRLPGQLALKRIYAIFSQILRLHLGPGLRTFHYCL